MAFVLPAGDYERALRMAGASNFMEALEAGIDRGMQRQQMRERAARARELYDRQKALESSALMAELEEIGREAYATGQAQQAAGVEAPVGGVAVSPSSAVGTASGAAASPTAAALADAVATPAAQTPQAIERAVASVEEEELPGDPTYRDIPTEKPWWYGGKTYEEAFPLHGPELPPEGPVVSALRRGLPPEEFALGTPRGPRVINDPSPDIFEVWRGEREPQVINDPNPVITEIWRAPIDPSSLPPEEFALGTPRGQSKRETDLREAARLIEQGRAADAQGLMGDSAQVYPSLGVETATEGPTIPFGAGRGEGQVYPDVGVDSATRGPGIGLDSATVQAPSSLDGVAGIPTSGIGSYAVQALGPAAMSSGDPVLAAALAASGAKTPLELAEEQQEQRRLQGIEEKALGAGSVAMGDLGFGTTSGSPLEQAVAKQAAAAEEVELAGPEPEAVKADQNVDVGGKVYTVKKGDILGRISSSFGTPLASVVAANQDVLAPGGKPRQIKRGEKVLLEGQDLIYPGDKIRIPTGEGRETGGEAGPVDPRPESGQPKGALAEAEAATKGGTKAEVKAELTKIQSKIPDLPLNPFQRFGRSVDYTPSLRAVAFATLRAQQGDFTMLNQMAGRQVRYSELPGLFAEYSNFVRGAKSRASEVYLQQELAKETQANEAKRRSAEGVRSFVELDLQRAGMSGDQIEFYSGRYIDMWMDDPAQARQMLGTIRTMGAEERAKEMARIKNSGFRRDGPGLGTPKQIEKAQKRLAKLFKARGDALKPLLNARGLSQGMRLGEEDLAALANDPIYAESLRAYGQADAMYEQGRMELKLLTQGPSDDDDGEPKDYVKATIAKQAVIDLAKRFSGDMDSFESGVERRLKAAGDPSSAENAKLVREHFEKGVKEEAAPTYKLPTPSDLRAEAEDAKLAAEKATTREEYSSARRRLSKASDPSSMGAAVTRKRQAQLSDAVSSAVKAGSVALEKHNEGSLTREDLDSALSGVRSAKKRLDAYRRSRGTSILAEIIRPSRLPGDSKNLGEINSDLMFYEAKLSKLAPSAE